MEVDYEHNRIRVVQNHIDPCVFTLMDQSESTRGLVLTHVNDLMLLTEPGLAEVVKSALSSKFPVEDWEADKFEYLGCEYICRPDKIVLHARNAWQSTWQEFGEL